MGHPFNPADLEQAENPYPLLADLRDAGPVLRLECGFWAVTGYEPAQQVLRQRVFASSPIAARFVLGLPEGAARDEMAHRVNFLDPPDHTRVRGLVSQAFTPRRVNALIPWIEQTAETLLDGIGPAHDFDLLSRFAHQLPSLVISELLGVPVSDRDQLTAWSDAVAPLLGVAPPPDAQARAVQAAEEFHAYLSELMEERRAHPGEDLLSALLLAEENGERLNRVELLSLAATLYSAGHRTTRDLFTNGMAALLGNPGFYQRVVAGHWSVRDTVNEFLRYDTPTLYVARVPMEPVMLEGIEIPAWEPVLVFLAAANRDPAVYADPDEFSPCRKGPSPLSFAHGAHYCLGAPLATAEAEIMLRGLTRRWPGLRLSEAHRLHWHQRGTFRGLDELMVQANGA